MGYTTTIIYQTDDRYILDVRQWSFSFWKKIKFWVWIDVYKKNHFQIGPLEVFRH